MSIASDTEDRADQSFRKSAMSSTVTTPSGHTSQGARWVTQQGRKNRASSAEHAKSRSDPMVLIGTGTMRA